MKIQVTGGDLSQQELEAYRQRAEARYPNDSIQTLGIHLDGEFVDLSYQLFPQDFSRIRRITGYLVGDMSRWNNGKRAEESDRIKHL